MARDQAESLPAATPARAKGRYHRVPEAAEILGLSARFIWAEIAAGHLKAIRFGQRATRIEDAELARYVEAARVSSSR